MKKKIVSLCLVLALAATAVVGGTLAYFTDTDKADNKFTMSTAGVDIELVEQQRNDEGTALEPFEQNKKLYPLVGSAQGAKDAFGLPLAPNYVDKIITIDNLEEDAYVRAFIAIPSVLDSENPGQNVLHFNDGNKFVEEGGKEDGQAVNPDYENWTESELVEKNVDIDGTDYNVYQKTYKKVLKEDEGTASAAWVGFYLDGDVDFIPAVKDANGTVTTKGYYTINGDKIEYDFENGITIPVYAQGVQATGFTSAQEAFEASGLPENPWK